MSGKARFAVRLARVISLSVPKEDIVDGWDTRYVRLATGKYMRADILLTPYEKLDWNSVKDCVLEAERLGYDSVILPDHPMMGRANLDCMAILGALAGITSKIKLGTMTTNTMRYVPSPALFAKQIATLDYITGGRIFPLGLGAGYCKEEYDAYGFPFATHLVRIEQLKETVEIMRRMFTEKKTTYKGKYFEIKDAICEPKPIQNPFPIIIGGSGKHTLKLIARHADVINLEGSVEDVERKLAVLEKLCKEAGRDWEQILKQWAIWFWIYEDQKERETHAEAFKYFRPDEEGGFLSGTPEQVIEILQKYVDLGITYFTLRFEDLPSKRGLRLFAEKVMPAFQ